MSHLLIASAVLKNSKIEFEGFFCLVQNVAVVAVDAVVAAAGAGD